MSDAVAQAPPTRLLPRRALPAIAVADVLAALIFAVLARRVHHQQQAGALDRAIDGRLTHHLFAYRIALRALVEVGAPLTVALSGIALALWCLATRRRRGALLSVLGPGLAALATGSVLKPVIGRTLYGSLAFPSGHTTGAVALAGVVGVLMLGPSHPRNLSVHARRLVALAALAVSGGTAIGLVALRWHYATDTVGGVCVVLVVVTLVAVVIDTWPVR